ncbi:MAG: hypothetical protein B6U97_03370 [Candidatus Altiarchaeales archaeon ex4484_96]|nr:MAG: hypothetical protein B6U97_03370 [Candidatus Altiarchaeales archaeon ex4484_96]
MRTASFDRKTRETKIKLDLSLDGAGEGKINTPMDDCCATCAVDLGGRPYSIIDIRYSEFKNAKLGDVSKENIAHFFESLALNAKMNLYLRVEGANDHHRVEACFKALSRALRDAVSVSGEGIPSTKGVI